MRVLMFGWEFPPFNSGGLGVASLGLASSISAKNVDVLFVLPKKLPVGSHKFKIIFAGGELSGLAVNSILAPYVSWNKYGLLRSHLPGSVYGLDLFSEVERYAKEAANIAKSESFDVIHAHDWLSFGAAVVAKKVSNKPFVAHVHATEVDRTAGKVNNYIYEREKEGLEMSDRVITVSGYTKDILVRDYGISPSKIDIVHNGIDKSNYNCGESMDPGLVKLKEAGYKIVLFVGRITIMKGPDYFVNVAKKILDYDKKVIFVVAGSGDMEGQIMNQAAAMKISDKMMFVGFLRGKELSRVYKAADIFVMPSVSEPFGLTPLESLVHETPVLVSKQSGVSEVLKHALKADFWDVDEMADKILSVLEHTSLKKTLAQNGNREALDCSWDKAADKVIGIYSSL